MWPLGGMSRVWPAGRVEYLDPRVVERCVLRVVVGRLLTPDPDLPGVEAGRRVDDRQSVAHQLAVGDQAELDGLHGLQVDRAALVGGHQVGDGDHRDLVHRFETAEAGAVRGVTQVLGDADRLVVRRVRDRGGLRGGRRLERDRLVVGAGELRCRGPFLHGDQLGAFLDLRDHIVAGALLRRDVEGLDGLRTVLDDQPEALGGALALGVRDLDAECAALPGRHGRHLERPQSRGLSGRQRGGHRGAACDGRPAALRAGRVGAFARHSAGRPAHPDDVGGGPAVVEEAVHRMCQEVPVGELAEGRDVLGPVGHQRRLVQRTVGCQPDECGHRGADPLDRTRAAGHLFHVHAGRQVRRHALLSSGYRYKTRLTLAAQAQAGKRPQVPHQGHRTCPQGQPGEACEALSRHQGSWRDVAEVAPGAVPRSAAGDAVRASGRSRTGRDSRAASDTFRAAVLPCGL